MGVDVHDRLIGKPSSPDDARAILQRLRGRSHDVVTAVSILHQSKTIDAVETVTYVAPTEIAVWSCAPRAWRW